MKTLISKAFVALALIASISSCKKDEPANDNQDAANFKTAFSSIVNANKPQQHVFTVSAVVGGTIIGNNTRLRFYPNAFITANGANVTGNVEVELREISSKAQMVLANKPTMSPDGLLESSGEAYVMAKQNGQTLRLRPGYSTIQFNGSSYNKPMSFFMGTEDANAFDAVSWNLAPNVSTTDAGFQCSSDSSSILVFVNNNNGIPTCDTLYTFPLDSFGWINCDYFLNQTYSNLTPLTVNVPDGYDDDNTIMYVVFSTINSVASVPNTAEGVFALAGSYQVPVGMQATIVAIRHQNGEFWSAIKPVTLTNNHTETLTFTQTTAAAFEAAVEDLE